MGAEKSQPAPEPSGPSASERLDSWKQIAAYLKRDERTVRRWEKEGLPVHRHAHKKKATVYAYKPEIDVWWNDGRARLELIEAAAAGRHRTGVWWATAGLMLLGAGLGLNVGGVRDRLLGRPGATPTVPAARFIISLPEKSELTPYVGSGPLVSPDGKLLAYVATGPEGRWLIHVRALDSLEARVLKGTDGAFLPFWSPDSRFLGFCAGGALKRVEAGGGPIQTISSLRDCRGGAWSPQGVILIGGLADAIYRVPASGGTPTSVTTLDKSGGERGHAWPHWLPDGRHFLYLALSDQKEKRAIYVASHDSKERKLLLKLNSSAVYAEPGYLFFVREAAVVAQPFDPKSLEVTGQPVVLAEDIYYAQLSGRGAFSVSQNGVFSWRSAFSVVQLTWYDRTGKPLGTIGPPGRYADIRLSPNTQWVAFTRYDPQGQNEDIWTLDLIRGTLSPLTIGRVASYVPVWSPDGKRIAFFSVGDKRLNLEATSLRGGEPEALATELPPGPWGVRLHRSAADWSRDGRYIIYSAFAPDRAWDIWVVPLEGDRKPGPLLRTGSSELDAQLSPDSRWLVYVSNESGKYEVYVSSFPDGAHKVQVSTAGGTSPNWAPDGRELYYVSPQKKLMAVDIKLAPAFAAGVPKPLFAIPASGTITTYEYQVARDGRFLIAAPVEEWGAGPFTVVLDWPAALKKK
jgi:Tol biopolymer transport system component